ncbi:MAG: cation transporter [Actinobacteria bacterium]|nr:cation transporter [Actinomycetota bacterium]
MTNQLVLQVGGMTCTGCEVRVGKVLGRLDGVRTAAADHQAGEVRVLFDSDQTSPASIGAAITAAGYQVNGEAKDSR